MVSGIDLSGPYEGSERRLMIDCILCPLTGLPLRDSVGTESGMERAPHEFLEFNASPSIAIIGNTMPGDETLQTRSTIRQ